LAIPHLFFCVPDSESFPAADHGLLGPCLGRSSFRVFFFPPSNPHTVLPDPQHSTPNTGSVTQTDHPTRVFWGMYRVEKKCSIPKNQPCYSLPSFKFVTLDVMRPPLPVFIPFLFLGGPLASICRTVLCGNQPPFNLVPRKNCVFCGVPPEISSITLHRWLRCFLQFTHF